MRYRFSKHGGVDSRNNPEALIQNIKEEDDDVKKYY
jgi:hypothetical protein